jgi:SP family sugar:H+ symporter-like MFS transporter
VAAIVFVFFCVPDCKGKTLEQIDFLFNQGVSLRDFGKTDAEAAMTAANISTSVQRKLSSDQEGAYAQTRDKF